MQKLKSFFYKKGFLKVTAKVKKTKRPSEVKKPNAKAVKTKKQRRQLPGLENQVWQVNESLTVYQLSLSSCLLMTDNNTNRQS